MRTPNVPHVVVTHGGRRPKPGQTFANRCQRCGLIDQMPLGVDPCHMCEGCYAAFKEWHQGPNLSPVEEPYHITLTRFVLVCPSDVWHNRPKDPAPADWQEKEKRWRQAAIKNDGSIIKLMGR